MKKQKAGYIQNKGKLFFWVLVLLAFVVVSFKFADLQQLYQNLKKADLLFISLALIAQLIYFILFTITYKIAFRIVKIDYSFKRLFPLTFAYIFVNVVAPTGGASGPALYAAEASHRKESPIRALAGVLVANLGQFITFSAVLFFGTFYLFTVKNLQAYQIIASVLLILLTAFLLSLIIMGIYSPKSLKIGMHWIISHLNSLFKFLHLKKRFSADWINEGVKEFAAASKNVTSQTKEIRKLFCYYFLVHFVNIISLYFIFIAFNQHILFRALIAGFVMGVVFQIVGITPYGIGLTESAMALTFTSLGVPTENAILITITYRSMTFWLPFFIGFILLRKIHIFGLQDISVIKLVLENKHVENIKNVIRVRFINIEKK